MGDKPTTTNGAATIADKVLHALIFDVAVSAAEAEIIAVVPAMGLPILKQIDEAVIKFVAEKIYTALALGATFAIIDAQTSAEASAANEAATNLKQALTGGDPNAVTKATEDFKAAFGKLVHYDGSATP
jgi:hypothetical protein